MLLIQSIQVILSSLVPSFFEVKWEVMKSWKGNLGLRLDLRT